ncbi:MAG: 4-hydroxy-tetrahydrodipicolinate reductase [candidate division WOR-3 bacterium]|nr:4-hydroxy-tetrahydrodipicolinate reductase [candidate division WOR-3 bacterium]
MLKIVVCGAAGRMGREIINLVQKSADIKIIAGVEEKSHPLVNKKIDDIFIHDDLSSMIAEVDCVVEFTNHTATMENLRKSSDYRKPYVIGTTGFSTTEIEEIKEFSKSFPIFLSPNMSLGVNHLLRLVRDTAQILSDYEIEIIETHHRAKRDAPSGTALAIADKIKEARPGINIIYGREGIGEGRKKEEVCISAVRGGDVVGEHRILFFGNGEFLELRHYATSRQCFASGTLEAVKFIVKQKPGLYSMQDLLKYATTEIH